MVVNESIYKKMKEANPTQKTEKEILQVIIKANAPISLTAIAQNSNKDIYQVKKAVSFFLMLGIIQTVVSSGNTTLVFLNKQVIQNAGATNPTS